MQGPDLVAKGPYTVSTVAAANLHGHRVAHMPMAYAHHVPCACARAPTRPRSTIAPRQYQDLVAP
eukprot:1444878-Rhodomonas_salina.2